MLGPAMAIFSGRDRQVQSTFVLTFVVAILTEMLIVWHDEVPRNLYFFAIASSHLYQSIFNHFRLHRIIAAPAKINCNESPEINSIASSQPRDTTWKKFSSPSTNSTLRKGSMAPQRAKDKNPLYQKMKDPWRTSNCLSLFAGAMQSRRSTRSQPRRERHRRSGVNIP